MNIKNIVFIGLLIVFVVGCKKEEQQKTLSVNEDLKNLLNISNYYFEKKEKKNDSIIEYDGTNKNFTIKGHYNFLNNNKTGWWKVYDKRNNEKYLDAEFVIEPGKHNEKRNQLIFYNNNKIDTLISKFYIKNILQNNFIEYKFYCPKDNDNLHEASFDYGIIKNENIIKTDRLKCIKIGNYYSCKIKIPQNLFGLIKIGGLFTEISNNKEKKEMGINEIFVQDTIR